jgi:hypothetical protein
VKQELALLSLAAVVSASAWAAVMPVIYPAKGQTTAQTDRDKLACYDWSRSQSGFDPLQAATPPAAAPATTASATSPTPAARGIDGNMIKGAAGGAAIAELTKGDAGKGAAIGVLGSGLRDQIRQQSGRQKQAQQQQQVAQQQQAAAAQQQATFAQHKAQFERGFAACLEARGYVVK